MPLFLKIQCNNLRYQSLCLEAGHINCDHDLLNKNKSGTIAEMLGLEVISVQQQVLNERKILEVWFDAESELFRLRLYWDTKPKRDILGARLLSEISLW